MKNYNQIYGNLSFGTGNWMKKKLFRKSLKNPYAKKVIHSYKKQILKDFKRMKVLNKLKNFSVMDVGTGRQSLAILNMGAKSVDHYDISLNNVRKFKKEIKSYKNISSLNADICEKNFNKNKKYDLIYLQGVIQHTRNPYKALNNLADATKKDGIIWLYHYQCTSLSYLYIFTLRQIFSKKTLPNLKKELKKIGISFKTIDNLMDDLGCDYMHLYNPKFYKINLEKSGFKQFYKKDVMDIDNGINCNVNKPTCLTAYKKIRYIKNSKKKYKPLNIFDYQNYQHMFKSYIKNINEIKRKIIYHSKSKSIKEKIDLCKPLLNGYISFSFKKKNKIEKLIDNFEKTLKNVVN